MLCTWLELRAATEQFRFAEKIFRFEAFRSFHWISMFHNGFESILKKYLSWNLSFRPYKAKLFKEAKFFVIIFTYLSYRSKSPWSTQQASSMHLRHGTSLLSCHFGPVLLS